MSAFLRTWQGNVLYELCASVAKGERVLTVDHLSQNFSREKREALLHIV